MECEPSRLAAATVEVRPLNFLRFPVIHTLRPGTGRAPLVVGTLLR